MTGGYKIIDLYGLDLANIQLDSTKIEKVYNDIESTYKTKALLFDNYKINGIEQNATFSSAVVKNSGFEITLGDYKLLIKTDSVVDSTLHLYRHDLYFQTTTINNFNAFIFVTLFNTNNREINNEEELLNNFTSLNTEATGYVINPSIGTYPIIYKIDINREEKLLYFNDDSYDFTINVLSDTITKIF